MWLTLLALRNRIGILMLSLAMVVLGLTSLQRLPVDLFPQIQVPVAFVGVIYKGAPPLDIEQSVVYPIEKPSVPPPTSNMSNHSVNRALELSRSGSTGG